MGRTIEKVTRTNRPSQNHMQQLRLGGVEPPGEPSVFDKALKAAGEAAWVIGTSLVVLVLPIYIAVKL
jgi:hypothetical protein